MTKTQIKICGLSTEAAIDAAIDAGADYIGLVHFPKSPRHVSLERAAELRTYAAQRVKTVLLLVNADPKSTGKAIGDVKPDVIQFHGSETPDWLKLVADNSGLEIWKALGVKDKPTLAKSARYVGAADRLLFDAPAKALPGGTGTSFDWSLLADHDHKLDWGLAGGLDPDNVADALHATHAPLVDVSSGVESAPGVKQVDRIAAFCQAVREFDEAG
ncbi:phosphoribosylanthranilate isomerase [Parasphingorhabdus flavimaris]|uniref:N-(5'-phosphoribosyl)anthranilate isomerase n=1 Tax=Parasphingorhabdus flavimaris TaxID=266812 RepID=A0ABX2N166_9SPHN|nr:phosphoribosylanthranilate isomerase [Parasphingorhabdus flavimaris]NVD27430.1 phosphoribosylanthranilate isomerase [Parasphingorhabdus flavimaris]|tara:strand:+ start:1985 stop:2632 length:648 start_codon:yes stop_codon:yes gene_type:complete